MQKQLLRLKSYRSGSPLQVPIHDLDLATDEHHVPLAPGMARVWAVVVVGVLVVAVVVDVQAVLLVPAIVVGEQLVPLLLCSLDLLDNPEIHPPSLKILVNEQMLPYSTLFDYQLIVCQYVNR